MPQTLDTTPEDGWKLVRDAFAAYPDLADLCGSPDEVRRHAGLTNRVFRLKSSRGTFFLRLPRVETAGSIDRKAEAENLSVAADLGLALPPLYCNVAAGILVTEALDTVPSLVDLPLKLGRVLGRLHVSGANFSGELVPQDVYRNQRNSLLGSASVSQDVETLESAMSNLMDPYGMAADDLVLVPSHGDLSPGNCLPAEDRLWLIDWEYSGMSDPAWDIAYAIQEHGFSESEEAVFLTAYRSEAADLLPDCTRVERMKSLCDAISALWALEQVVNGRDQEGFLAFARQRLQRITARNRRFI